MKMTVRLITRRLVILISSLIIFMVSIGFFLDFYLMATPQVVLVIQVKQHPSVFVTLDQIIIHNNLSLSMEGSSFTFAFGQDVLNTSQIDICRTELCKSQRICLLCWRWTAKLLHRGIGATEQNDWKMERRHKNISFTKLKCDNQSDHRRCRVLQTIVQFCF